MKKILILLVILLININTAYSADIEPVSGKIKLPEKYTTEYINSLNEEYKKVGNVSRKNACPFH